MARNTGGWREILADGEKYWRMARNTGGWRENTGGWQKILADSQKYWRIAENTLAIAKNNSCLLALFNNLSYHFERIVKLFTYPCFKRWKRV